MFNRCDKFNSDLSGWNFLNGINFSYMFYRCHNFNSNLSRWNVSNGINFEYMFYKCEKFNADLSNWNVKNAESWTSFAKNSLLEEYPERIPEKFRSDYL